MSAPQRPEIPPCPHCGISGRLWGTAEHRRRCEKPRRRRERRAQREAERLARAYFRRAQ